MRTYRKERDELWEKQFASVFGKEEAGAADFIFRKLRQKDGGFDYFEMRSTKGGGTDSRYFAVPEHLQELKESVLSDAERAGMLSAAMKEGRLSRFKNGLAVRKYRSLLKKDLQTLLSEGQRELVKVAYEHLCLVPEGTSEEMEGYRLVYDGLCGTIPTSVRKKMERECEENRTEILLGKPEEEAATEESPKGECEASEEELDAAAIEEVEREIEESRKAAAEEPSVIAYSEETPDSTFSSFAGTKPKEEGGVYYLTSENVKEEAYRSYEAAVAASTMVQTPRAYAIEEAKEVFRCGDALLACLWQPELDKDILSDSGGGLLVVNTAEEGNRHGVILVRFQRIIQNEYSTTFDLQIRDSVDEITKKRVCTATVFRPNRPNGPKRVKINLEPELTEALFAPLDKKIAVLTRPVEQPEVTELYQAQRREEPEYFRDRQ